MASIRLRAFLRKQEFWISLSVEWPTKLITFTFILTLSSLFVTLFFPLCVSPEVKRSKSNFIYAFLFIRWVAMFPIKSLSNKWTTTIFFIDSSKHMFSNELAHKRWKHFQTIAFFLYFWHDGKKCRMEFHLKVYTPNGVAVELSARKSSSFASKNDYFQNLLRSFYYSINSIIRKLFDILHINNDLCFTQQIIIY